MGHTVPTVTVVSRTVLQKGRNVALERAKPRKGRFREEIGRKRGPGRKGGGGEGKPSPLQLVSTRRCVGAFQTCVTVGLKREPAGPGKNGNPGLRLETPERHKCGGFALGPSKTP